MGAERRYYHEFDAARSVLMMLGVVLHAANVYRTDEPWLVTDRGHPFFGALSDTIHVFRMPAFFMISGFFCAMSLGRTRPGPFLARRLLRIGVPLAVTGLTLNSVQTAVLSAADHPGAGAGELARAVLASWRTGAWITHLWFLVYLLAYLGLAALLARAAWPVLRAAGGGVQRVGEGFLGRSGLVFVLLPTATFAVLAAARAVPALYDAVYGELGFYTFLFYAPFFAAGALLHQVPSLLESFSRPRLVLVPWIVVAVWLEVSGFRGPGGEVGRVLDVGAHCLAPWLTCHFVFALFRRAAARPSRAWRWLSEGSYTVYLFHHLTVILLATALLELAWAPGLEFALIVLATAAATLAIHAFLVLRFPLLGLLFNGKLRPRKEHA